MPRPLPKTSGGRKKGKEFIGGKTAAAKCFNFAISPEVNDGHSANGNRVSVNEGIYNFARAYPFLADV